MSQYFMPIYTTVVGTIIGILVAWIRSLISKRKDEHATEENITNALKEGMAILLRRQLFEWYASYEYQDSIPISDWEEIEETHRVYKALGGNHSGDRVFDTMRSKHIGG